MSITKKKFGQTKDGQAVFVYRLTNQQGAYIEVLDFGAILRVVAVPDRTQKLTDVVLGYDTVSGYENGGCFFGATIGRSGNRIAGGSFQIQGKTYQMKQNENNNNLHSGPGGYESRMWTVREENQKENSITLSLHSPHKDQGFPGNLDVNVKYELSDDNELIIHYTGICDEDTVMNMTNHSYFNLDGHTSNTNNNIQLQILAEGYTPVMDSASIPTGEIAPVSGTPMDFTQFKEIGTDINTEFDQLKYTGGYDHNYACRDYEAGIERVIANAYGPKTGITMEVISDLPGVQFYAGNFVKDQQGKEGMVYGKRSAFCLETQYFPNSINEEKFVSPILSKGSMYNTVTIYHFGIQ